MRFSLRVLRQIFMPMFGNSPYKIISINDGDSLLKFNSELQSFESHFTYPLNATQRFKIIHGKTD